MTKYAYFNHADPDPKRVRGWIDTTLHAESEFVAPLPDDADLMELTEDQWDARIADSSYWWIRGGRLEYARPPPKQLLEPQSMVPASKYEELLARIEQLEKKLEER